MVIKLNNRPVDDESLQVDGIDTRDAPDFVDAYFSEGQFEDGIPITEDELGILGLENPSLLYAKINERLYDV